jgi:hypothetical protein
MKPLGPTPAIEIEAEAVIATADVLHERVPCDYACVAELVRPYTSRSQDIRRP